MALNYQDVIRDVHDPVNHALQISGTIQAAGQATVSLLGTPTVMVGTPTLFAVVNTSAAGVGNSIVTINPRVDYIGLMSVSGNVNISNPTLYAVVNTSAAGVGNSIVTVANPDFGINAGVNSIGFATVTQVNQPALVASSANIGSVSILGGVLNTVSAVTDITNPIAIKGNVTLSDSKGFIGLTSIQGNVNLNAGINNIGFATVHVGTPTLYAVVNTTASSGLATIDIRNTINANVSLSNSLSQIGFATVAVSTPTLYAVVNTGAVGVQNSIVTLASSIPAGINGIGFATVNVAALTLGTYAVDDSAMPATPQTLPISAEYRLAATTYTDGDVTVLQSDENGNLKVTLANQLAGEDLTDNLIKVGGNIVHDSADAGNPVKVGGKAASSEPSAVTAGDRVNAYFDTTGHQHVKVDAIAAGVNNIGFATVYVSTPTLYAVVNTGAVGTTNSMVTINPRTDYFGLVSVSGNVAVSSLPATPAGANYIGLVTLGGGPINLAKVGGTNIAPPTEQDGNSYDAPLLVASLPAVMNSSTSWDRIRSVNAANATTGTGLLGAGILGFDGTNYQRVSTDTGGQIKLGDPKTYIGLVTITGSLAAASGNVTITDGKTFIGSVSVTGTVGLNAGIAGIGFATVNVVNQPALVASSAFIGLVTVANTVPVTGTFWQATQPVSGTVAATQSGTWDEVGINDSGNSITIDGNVGILGNVTLSDSKTYVGLVSVSGSVGLNSSTLNIGSVSILGGSVVANLNTGTLNIGSVSVLGGTINATLQSSTLNVGSVSILGGKIVNDTSTLNIGSVSVLGGVINANLNTGTLNIGSVSILGGTIKLAEPNVFIGLTTSVNGAGTQFIGLVTAWSRNAGTTKTLISLPVGLGNNSLATVAVPTNANKVNVTQLILNSNVTTEIAIKSGATYLTGNASLGVTLFPGGGFVMNGAPDSPAWIGLPSGAMVVEKRDSGGTVSKIGGGVIYFDET